VSGVLAVTRAGVQRVLHLLDGAPVAFSSTVPGDSLASILVEAAGLSAKRAREWVDADTSGTDLLDARVAAGELSPAAAQAAWRAWLTHGIRAPLEWGSGVWIFRREERLRAGCVDPLLLPGVTSLGTLRASLDALVPADVALADARERAAPLHPGTRFDQLVHDLDLPDGLGRVIATGGQLGPLVGEDRTDALLLARLVWLLVRLRVVSSGGAPAPADLLVQLLAAGRTDPPPLEPPPKPTPHAPPPARKARKKRRRTSRGPRTKGPNAGPEPTLNAVITMLRVDRDSRLGRDHYRFLGVREDEARDRMEQAIKRLGLRWKDALRDPRVDADSRETATQLLKQLDTVAEDLRDAQQQAAYDARIGLVRSPFALDPEADDPLLASMEFEGEETR